MEEINLLKKKLEESIQYKKDAEKERDKLKLLAEETIKINEKMILEIDNRKHKKCKSNTQREYGKLNVSVYDEIKKIEDEVRKYNNDYKNEFKKLQINTEPSSKRNIKKKLETLSDLIQRNTERVKQLKLKEEAAE